MRVEFKFSVHYLPAAAVHAWVSDRGRWKCTNNTNINQQILTMMNMKINEDELLSC